MNKKANVSKELNAKHIKVFSLYFHFFVSLFITHLSFSVCYAQDSFFSLGADI